MMLTIAAVTLAFIVLDTAGDQLGTWLSFAFFILQMVLPLLLFGLVEKLFRARVFSFCLPASERAREGPEDARRRSGGGEFGGRNPIFEGVELVPPQRRVSGAAASSSMKRLRLSDRRSFSSPSSTPFFAAESAAPRLSASALSPQTVRSSILSPVPLSLALAIQETAASTTQQDQRASWLASLEARERRSFRRSGSLSANL